MLPKVYVELNKLFTSHGYSLYMVGGTARDYILGYKLFDFDFVTDALPEEIASFLDVPSSFIKMGSTTITYMGEKVDITTLRKEGPYLDYRHPASVEYVKDTRSDSSRRDFTINAIYINDEGTYIDYYNGQRDLQNKIIRMIGDPFSRLEEDPLRILRAIRFASFLSFKIDETLILAIKEKKHFLKKISYAKCVDELLKMKKTCKEASMKLLLELGINEEIPLDYDASKNSLMAIDMHCDTMTKLHREGQELYKNDLHIDIERLIKGQYMLQCFAIFVYLGDYSPFNKFNEYLTTFNREMEKNSAFISQVRNYQELMNNKSCRKMSALLTVEEGEVIEGDLAKLDYLYEKGVRMMTLTWNFKNCIGSPNITLKGDNTSLTEVNTKDGLTTFGIQVVKRMNELGMIIDVSHLSDAGFYDVIKYSSFPIVASHSNSRKVQNVARNLTDDMILKIKENGGVIGINYCNIFISYSSSDQINDIVEHIKHIVDVGGIGVVALGSDFDGISTPIGMHDCTQTLRLRDALKEAGFTQNDINKIFHDNFLRVFKKVCK